jgi:hypothetical protein
MPNFGAKRLNDLVRSIEEIAEKSAIAGCAVLFLHFFG